MNAVDSGVIAARRHKARRLGVAVLAVAVALVLAAIMSVLRARGGGDLRTSRDASNSSPISRRAAAPSRPLVTAVAWVDGLADGLILPGDMFSHLEQQEPGMARVVSAAWSDLTSSVRPRQIQSAVTWIDGLARGFVLPSDVRSRLQVHDPSEAGAILRAWSVLRTLPTRPMGPSN